MTGTNIMNARVAKEEIALLMPTSLSRYADEPMLHDEAPQSGLMARLSAALTWVIDLPRRQAVLAELSQLSEHELADIGLSRTDLSRVFDRSFAAQRSNHA
jgi:hypothetical protein